MNETEKQSALENQSFGKRMNASIPGILTFAFLCYFWSDVARFGITSDAPLWERLPFFVYCGLTAIVGLDVALLVLLPKSRSESLRAVTGQLVSWTFSLFCLGTAVVIIALLVRFPSNYTPAGSLLFSSVACVLLVVSLVFPVKTIWTKLKLGER